MIYEQKKIAYRGKIVFERLVMSAAFKRLPKVFLEDETCFLYLTKGAFVFRTPTRTMKFSEGDIMLARCGNYLIENASINPEADTELISVVGAFFFPSLVKQFFPNELSIDGFKNRKDVSKSDLEPLMKTFLDSVNFMFDNPAIADDNLVSTKLKELLILLSASEGAQDINEFVTSLFTSHEYSFREIIESNLYSGLSLQEYAYLCNMSLATFKRTFSQTYHESPARYIKAKQLEKAHHLLAAGNSSMSEIFLDCGFTSISSFSRAFKKQYAVMPKEVRLSRTNKKLS